MKSLKKINKILEEYQVFETNTDLSEEEKELLREGGLLDDDKNKVQRKEPQDI